MPFYICPRCKTRRVDHDGREGFSSEPPACQHCGFGFMFELLNDYYPAQATGFVVCDRDARVLATGFFRQKAKALRGTMRILIDDFHGEVPTAFDGLLRLPGVARKTANVVSAERGNAQGIVVDTHVRRLSQRLGLTRQEDPVKIERDLVRIVPREDWARFPHLLIWHGRRGCDARRPACERCVLNDLCPSSRVDAAAYRGVSATSSPPSSS
jgi:hypothetical protein